VSWRSTRVSEWEKHTSPPFTPSLSRGVLLLLFLTNCTFDPRADIDQASIRVHVDGLTEGGATLVLTALDASGSQLVKRSTVTGRTEVEVLFEKGLLLEGDVELGAVLTAEDGRELACGTAHGAVGAKEAIPLSMIRANDDLNCGGCGVLCPGETHATRSCDRALAVCAGLTCERGWYDVNGDPADGCEMTCAAPSAESTVASCSDGQDNDCDGKTDCADEACAGFTRGCAFGACTGEETWTCATNAWSTCGASPSGEATPAACTDGMDNDCDGKADCLDEGCQGISQSCTVQTCVGTQLFVCAQGNFGTCAINDTLESTQAQCLDGVDNDCDGKTDCAESACHDELREASIATCKDGIDNDCDGKADCDDTVCQDPSLEANIAACSDGIDNDCDGKVDCQDNGCLNIKQACTGTDICASGVKTWLCNVRLFSLCSVYVPLPENLALVCGDGLDNDCDGKRDCADTECTGKGCGLGMTCCPDGTCAAACQ
jgi:hypothetical protein